MSNFRYSLLKYRRFLFVLLRDKLLSNTLIRQSWQNHHPSQLPRKSGVQKLFILCGGRKKYAEIKVSVILAVRNNGSTIKKSIQSLQNQEHHNLEIVVINDASMDNTLEEILALSSNDPRIIVKSNPEALGTSISRNLGLDASTGDYITFQDGDDFSDPMRITHQLRAILKNRFIHLSMCDYVRILPNGNVVNINKRWARKCIISMMFHRRTFQILGYFKDVPVSEDSDYYERIKAVYGEASIKIVGKILYKATFQSNSRMFGEGQVKESGVYIRHQKSKEEDSVDLALRNSHKAFAKGAASPYHPGNI